MAVDPNVYALSIAIQLESADAFDTLDKFGQAAADVEDRISTAAQNTINSLSGIADHLTQSLSDAADAANEFTANSTELETVLSKAAEAIKEAYDTENDTLENTEKKIKFLEEIDVLLENIGASIVDENKSLQEQNVALQQVVAHTANTTQNANNTNTAFRKTVGTLSSVWGILKGFDEETEKFATATFRAYGSQQDLANSTRNLSSEYGVFREEAIETYKALANVKTPRNEIDKLAATVGRANRTTGVGIDTLATYTLKLRGAGFGADQTRKNINMLSAAQRKFGLSTYDVQKAIESQTLSAGQQVIHFGKDAPEAFMKASLGLAALDKELGTNSAEDWMKRLQLTGVEGEVFWQKFGVDASASVEDKFNAMSKVANTTARNIGVSMERMASGDLTPQMRSQVKLYAETMDLTEEMIYANAKAQANLTEEQKLNMMTMDGIGAAFEDQIDAEKRWKESMASLTASLKELKAFFSAVIGVMLQSVATVLVPVIWVLGGIVKAIITLVKWIGIAIDFLFGWIPGWNYLVTAIKWVGSALLGLIIIYVATGWAMAAFSATMAASSGIMVGAVATMTTLGTALTTLAVTLGGAIVTILTSIGAGFAALGAAVAPFIGPLIELGFAVLMVGAGFFLMGLGMYYAAQGGWAAIGMLVAMTAAMILMVVTFAIIATVVAPAVPLIYTLAGAVALLGLGAMMAGAGMYLMGMSVQMLATYGSQAVAIFPALAAGVLLLAAAGWLGSSGIAMLAGALFLLVIPLALLAPMMFLISSALDKMSGEAMSEFASALLDASWKIALALIVMIPVIMMLPAMAAGLMIAGMALIVAGVVFAIASFLIGFGAKLLGEGMSALAVGAKDFEGVDFIGMASQLMVGGLMLMYGGTAFAIGATLVGIGALLLGYGLQSLGPGAQQLKDIDFVEMAYQLMVGGFWLAIGGTAFVVGATLVGIAALLLGAGLFILGKGAQQLADIDFSDMSKQLAEGGILLIYAALPLMIGAVALAYSAMYIFIAGVLIGTVGEMLAEGAAWVKVGAEDLYDASYKLLRAGTNLSIAGPLLIAGAVALFFGASLLLPAAIILATAGSWLLPAAINLLLGLWWLEIATTRFKRSTGDIEKLGKSMYLLATSFDMLQHAQVGSLGDVADSLLSALPTVNKVAKELDKSASIFQKAADKFVKPVTAISAALQDLGDAMASINQHGMAFQEDIDKLGGMLEKYAQIMQGTAIKVETAVVAKAAPAMREARSLGIDAARSEAITTVQVMDKTEGDAEKIDKHTLLATEQVSLLHAINDKLDGVQEGGRGELTAIVELLETYLPEITGKDEGLSTEFNQWMK